MYSFEVRFRIERQALDINLVHVYAIVLHYFLQVLNRLVSEWVNQLNALEVLGCNLLGFCLLIKPVFFGLTLYQVEKLFVAFKIYLVPRCWHLSPFS